MTVLRSSGRLDPWRISPRSRNTSVFEAYDQFLDMVCYSKGSPKGGDVINVVRK